MTRQMRRDLYAGAKSDYERRTDLFIYLLYRPISIALTPAFLRLGMSATAVTLLNLVLACALPAIALVAQDQAYLGLALITFVFIVLDCVDGNIARATGSGSDLGQYLDSFVGKLYHLLLFVALALVAAREVPAVDPGYWLAGGLAVGLLKVWGRESRTYFKLNFGEAEAPFTIGPLNWQQALFSAAELVPFGLLALGLVDAVWLLLVGFGLLNLAVFLRTQVRILRRLVRAAPACQNVASRPEAMPSKRT